MGPRKVIRQPEAHISGSCPPTTLRPASSGGPAFQPRPHVRVSARSSGLIIQTGDTHFELAAESGRHVHAHTQRHTGTHTQTHTHTHRHVE